MNCSSIGYGGPSSAVRHDGGVSWGWSRIAAVDGAAGAAAERAAMPSRLQQDAPSMGSARRNCRARTLRPGKKHSGGHNRSCRVHSNIRPLSEAESHA
eukprot:6173633-Pleurochrysis_carterae.AAC.2